MIMDIIRFALPNLFTYLDSTYGVRISEMSTLDEAQKLLSELKEYTESYLKLFSLDKSWYKLINEVYIKNTYLSNSLRNYFDTNPQELCFSKDLSITFIAFTVINSGSPGPMLTPYNVPFSILKPIRIFCYDI